jgi:integrase
MDTPATRNKRIPQKWPHRVSFGRVKVTIYQRRRADGSQGFEVANYADGKRRLESFPDATAALDRADQLARQLSEGDVLAANLRNEDAAAYTSTLQTLAPYNVSLPAVAATVAACLKLVGDLPNLLAAAKLYASRNRKVERKPVRAVIDELLAVKASRGAAARSLQDLRSRLGRFAETFRKDACDVTTGEIQAWLDGLQLAPQSYTNFRRVVHLAFEFAVARGYALDNPTSGVEVQKVRGGDTEIFTPQEMAKLLDAVSTEFLPCLAIGGFSGLRSAEIERLDWREIDLKRGWITVGSAKSKTGSRRMVSVSPNLAAWLAPHARGEGPVWPGSHEDFYAAQQAAAKAAGIKWKANALRHSYASYRCAQTGDAGKVAGELGNSAAVVHRHYRELVTPDQAAEWFAIRPMPANSNLISIPFAS